MSEFDKIIGYKEWIVKLSATLFAIPKGAESVKIDGRRFFWKRLLLPYSIACHKFPEYAILPYEKLTLINFSLCLKGIGYLKIDA